MISILTKTAVRRPKTVISTVLVLTSFFLIQFHKIKIDTDPENMLENDQPDREFYNRIKQDFGIHDLLAVGIKGENGIFTPDAMKEIAEITDDILKIKGVIAEDVVSLRTSLNITSENGTLSIRPFMEDIPQTNDAAETMRKAVSENPFFRDKIISEDGKAAAVYIPIRSKDQSWRISKEIEGIMKKRLSPERKYYLAGLPAAEDTFGHEMFVQMAVTAPAAGFFIMILLFLLFRKWAFVIPPMADAMLSVIWAMGLLIGMGFTVHIMSSMIPIFLMPIALLDDIHILSDFFERYPYIRDKEKTILSAMKDLYRPMFFTSLTSAVGFASLALADIPPVKVFGLFVAFGIIAAWLFSHTVVPAVIMLMDEKKLAAFLDKRHKGKSGSQSILSKLGRFSFRNGRLILLGAGIITAAGAAGIRQIHINDNPVKWFKAKHKVRIANDVMNRDFSGTYTAYLAVRGKTEGAVKNPQVMRYIGRLQNRLESLPFVGKTSSAADIVKRINYVLHDKDISYDSVPEKKDEVSQYLFLFSMAGDPDDLDNFIDYPAQKANIWVQMKSGDNIQMGRAVKSVNKFMQDNPPPPGITVKWSGLTYINSVWQRLMVYGMLKAVLGSFVIVLLLMSFEFRSAVLGIISMVPLSFTIILSYGLVGAAGKDYDMPIAVCSALSLGMAIDFAIHFLQRFKAAFAETESTEEANTHTFGEPAKAISRNAVVITLGFLPLLGATLTPYVTVGLFFACLMVFSFLSTLIILPALISVFHKIIFPKEVHA